jgi:RNA polymerase sigma-70 factor (ECF subfamily)
MWFDRRNRSLLARLRAIHAARGHDTSSRVALGRCPTCDGPTGRPPVPSRGRAALEMPASIGHDRGGRPDAMDQPIDSSEPERLMAVARAGDSVALGHLLELYSSYLALMARLQVGRRLQGKVDPSDLVQETFLEAHRDFPRFRGRTEGELLAWLRQILTRNLANAIRRYYGTQARDLNLERELSREFDESWKMLDGGLVAQQSSPSHQASRREQAVLLANALDRLPDDYRETIVLRHLEGLSFPEVARRMERTEDSVKKLWARALARLRRALQAVMGDSG